MVPTFDFGNPGASHPKHHPDSGPSGGGSTHPEARLAALGLKLPTPAVPVAAYVPTRLVGNLLFVAGQIPWEDGKLPHKGLVPGAVSIETAQHCAKMCALNGLAAAKIALGDLGRIKSVVRVGCFVACDGTFADHPKIANGASELLVQVFGDAGKHARAAVGSSSLPLGVPVEVEFVFEVA